MHTVMFEETACQQSSSDRCYTHRAYRHRHDLVTCPRHVSVFSTDTTQLPITPECNLPCFYQFASSSKAFTDATHRYITRVLFLIHTQVSLCRKDFLAGITSIWPPTIVLVFMFNLMPSTNKALPEGTTLIEPPVSVLFMSNQIVSTSKALLADAALRHQIAIFHYCPGGLFA